MATKYCCNVDRCEGLYDESVALFSNQIVFSAMYAFADACLNDETVSNARIIDLDTGEVIYDAKAEKENPIDILEGCFDEIGYNPYMGCYDFDC